MQIQLNKKQAVALGAIGAGLAWWAYQWRTYANVSVKEGAALGFTSSEEKLIAGLDPKFQPVVRQFVTNARAGGFMIRITQGRRTIAEQNDLYAQGRTKPGAIVTGAVGGSSPHNYGMAVDFAFLTPEGKLSGGKDGGYSWGNDRPWGEVAKYGKALGLEWGGDWRKFKDRPHLEMPGWRALRAQWQAGTLKVA
jgi:hypothetical protein